MYAFELSALIKLILPMCIPNENFYSATKVLLVVKSTDLHVYGTTMNKQTKNPDKNSIFYRSQVLRILICLLLSLILVTDVISGEKNGERVVAVSYLLKYFRCFYLETSQNELRIKPQKNELFVLFTSEENRVAMSNEKKTSLDK